MLHSLESALAVALLAGCARVGPSAGEAARCQAIGESGRMTSRFPKPAG